MPTQILIVDDEKGMLQILGLLLKREGYEPLYAEEAQEALDIIYKYHPKLIILDDMLPGKMDGGQLCARIKQDAAVRNIPIIMHSAGIRIQNTAFIAEIGADAALSKPCPPARMLKTISEFLSQRV